MHVWVTKSHIGYEWVKCWIYKSGLIYLIPLSFWWRCSVSPSCGSRALDALLCSRFTQTLQQVVSEKGYWKGSAFGKVAIFLLFSTVHNHFHLNIKKKEKFFNFFFPYFRVSNLISTIIYFMFALYLIILSFGCYVLLQK